MIDLLLWPLAFLLPLFFGWLGNKVMHSFWPMSPPQIGCSDMTPEQRIARYGDYRGTWDGRGGG